MRPRLIAFAWLVALFSLQPHTSWANDPELDALLLESSNLMQDGRIEEALILLEGAQPSYGDSREFMNNLAIAYLGNSQPEEALSIFRELVDMDPLYSIIAHNLLEMELQISESRPEQISPLLFVQSVESYYEDESQPPGDSNTAQTATQTGTADADIIASVQRQVRAWASLWSAKDFFGYLSMYSREFTGPGGESFSQWARERRAPLSKPGPISVQVNNFSTTVINADEVQVSFDQDYNSSNYSDRVRKQLVLTRENQTWKIIKEVTLETY